MAALIDVTESAIMARLVGFLRPIVAEGTAVVQGQINRVPPPANQNFIVLTPLLRARLSTNLHIYAEAQVTGSIAGTVLTVTETLVGHLAPGLLLAGDGVAPDTTITAVLSGTPGAEQYRVSVDQTVPATTIYAGSKGVAQHTEMTVQVDAFGPASADNAQVIATLWRDEYACESLLLTDLPIQPLYCMDPRQLPFWGGENQTINRWSVDLTLQANITTTIPQSFAGAVTVGLLEIDATYPP